MNISTKSARNDKSIALGLNLVPNFVDGAAKRFPDRSKNKHILSCLLFYGPGKTETDRPLANQIVQIKNAKDKNRPERY